MGWRGRKLVEQNYSWDQIGKEMVVVYEWVSKGATPPVCVDTEVDLTDKLIIGSHQSAAGSLGFRVFAAFRLPAACGRKIVRSRLSAT